MTSVSSEEALLGILRYLTYTAVALVRQTGFLSLFYSLESP